MLWFILGLMVGQLVMLFFTKVMHRRMMRSNAHLAAESDYNFMLMKHAVSLMTKEQKDAFCNSKEAWDLEQKFQDNKAEIDKKGRY